MATAVGTLRACPQGSAGLSSDGRNDGMMNRKKRDEIKRCRMERIPTCTLQIGQEDALQRIQQLEHIFSRKSSKGLKALIQERRDDVDFDRDLERAERWSKRQVSLRSKLIQAELVNLATLAASDRTEMYSTVPSQPDNWNLLFHSTIALTSVVSASAAAISGAGHRAPVLCVGASILGLGTAGLMAMVTKFQPSQLAVEQPQVSRFSRDLTMEVETTLDDCASRSEARFSYVEEKLGALRALDTVFPLPIAPDSLGSIPEVLRPCVLSESPVTLASRPMIRLMSRQSSDRWTYEIEEEVRSLSSWLRSVDISASVEAPQTVNHMSKVVTVASPMLVLASSFINVLPGMLNFPDMGAAITLCALFVHSFSNGLQLGALYEDHRNVASHSNVDRSIERSSKVPTEERQSGRLYLERVALQLNQDPSVSTVLRHCEETAGIFF